MYDKLSILFTRFYTKIIRNEFLTDFQIELQICKLTYLKVKWVRVKHFYYFHANLAHAVEQLSNWLVQLENDALLTNCLDDLRLIWNVFFAWSWNWLILGILFNSIMQKMKLTLTA